MDYITIDWHKHLIFANSYLYKGGIAQTQSVEKVPVKMIFKLQLKQQMVSQGDYTLGISGVVFFVFL